MKTPTAAVLVPAAALTFGACTSAPEFTQFHEPRGGPPVPAVENQLLNDVQHRVDRPLDNNKAVDAAAAASIRCQHYPVATYPSRAVPPDPLASVPGIGDDELTRTTMELATHQSALCQATNARVDQERTAAEARARAEAEAARARAEAKAKAEAAAREEAAARKARQAASAEETQSEGTPSPKSRNSSGSSSSSTGLTCEPGGYARFGDPSDPNKITNKACGYTDSHGNQRSHDPWIDDQYQSETTSPQGGEEARQYQQWYGPNGPGSKGQLPGKITPECDAACARGN